MLLVCVVQRVRFAVRRFNAQAVVRIASRQEETQVARTPGIFDARLDFVVAVDIRHPTSGRESALGGDIDDPAGG